MSGRDRKRRSNGRAARVERDVLDATIDVCDEEWGQRATAQLARLITISAGAGVIPGWNSSLCLRLCAVADAVESIPDTARNVIEWVVAALAQAHGLPPFIARIIGRLVANWLLPPDDPVEKAATRLRVLGVLFCAEAGDLGGCPCLADLAERLTVDELKKHLAEDLNIAPQPSPPTTPRAEPQHFATRGDTRARSGQPSWTEPDPPEPGTPWTADGPGQAAAPADTTDGPDERLVVACDEVRGTNRVPTTATYGTEEDGR